MRKRRPRKSSRFCINFMDKNTIADGFSVYKSRKEMGKQLAKQEKCVFDNNTLVVDIDGVVASIVEDGDYSKAQPIKKNISVLNNLIEYGLKIIYYTARGSVSGIDWEDLTKEQFKRWKIKFDELKSKSINAKL